MRLFKYKRKEDLKKAVSVRQNQTTFLINNKHYKSLDRKLVLNNVFDLKY